jgi:hypothetical protein
VAFAVSGVAVMGILFGVLAGGITAASGRAGPSSRAGRFRRGGGSQAVLPDFPLLMGLRVVEGAGHLLLVVAMPTLMAALAAERDRALVMGIWATFFGVGFSLAALVIGQAGRRRSSPSTAGWRRSGVLLWHAAAGVTPERSRCRACPIT